MKEKNTPPSQALPKIKEPKTKKSIKWEKPTLEDVSKSVMAQPYIRFT